MLDRNRPRLAAALVFLIALAAGPAEAREKWPRIKADDWYRARPWPVGCNYIPSTAINQLEMWQAVTFDPATIDRELGWAEGLGFNSVRVFLHNLPYQDDPEGFLKRIDAFLAIADRHRIGVMLVLFDSVWDPFPAPGRQREPRPRVHNSGWVQAPGLVILRDPARHPELEPYVRGVVGRFKDDKRVHMWDLINEPDNRNRSSYGKDEPADKADLAISLLKKAVKWSREAEPSQPITSGVWAGEWAEGRASPTARLQLEESDIITFHDYSKPEVLRERVASLRGYGRPILCTEYMARPAGSTFDPCLRILKDARVGAYNWGFVDGKSQTIYPWDSWGRRYDAEPPTWFHDIFRRDGTPHDPREVAFIRGLTGGAGR